MARNSVQRGIAVLALGGLLLSGCTSMQYWRKPVRPATEQGPGAEQILTDCRTVTSPSKEVQDHLYQRLRGDLQVQDRVEYRFALVCLALQPHRPRQDRVWARDLLREYQVRDDRQPNLAILAGLLEDLITRQLTVEQQLIESRKREETLDGKLKTLDGKLKALEDIEKIIREREEGGSTAPME